MKKREGQVKGTNVVCVYKTNTMRTSSEDMVMNDGVVRGVLSIQQTDRISLFCLFVVGSGETELEGG